MENQKEILCFLCQDFISDISHLLKDHDYFHDFKDMQPNQIIEIIMFSMFVIAQGYIIAQNNLSSDKINHILEEFNDEIFDFIINKLKYINMFDGDDLRKFYLSFYNTYRERYLQYKEILSSDLSRANYLFRETTYNLILNIFNYSNKEKDGTDLIVPMSVLIATTLPKVMETCEKINQERSFLHKLTAYLKKLFH